MLLILKVVIIAVFELNLNCLAIDVFEMKLAGKYQSLSDVVNRCPV
jgi:hypothetical protein